MAAPQDLPQDVRPPGEDACPVAPAPGDDRRRRPRRWLAWTGAAVLVVAVVVAGRFVDLDLLLQTVRGWARQLGPWAPALYVALYVGAVLLALPGTPFTVLAAFLFGTTWGFGVMVVATTLAASAGFLAARYVAREAIERRVRRHPALNRVAEMVEGNDWFVIPFLHLMPVMPFALTNYCLGLTKVPFWRFLLWSELVMIPMNAVWVFGADALWRAATKGEPAWGLIAATGGASVALLVLGVLMKRTMNQRRSGS